MKIAICSDLHLEFGPIEINNPGDVDVLVLSGDICTARHLDWAAAQMYGDTRLSEMALRYHNFFQHVNSQFPHVIYVSGNHEHYNFDFKYTLNTIKTQLERYKNIHVLDNETVDIGDFTFLGATLWTDMNKEDPVTIQSIGRMMNDFRCVENSNKMVTFKDITWAKNPNGTGEFLRDAEGNMVQESVKFRERPATFSPTDAVEEHKKTIQFIKDTITSNSTGKYVFCGHHTPSHFSCHPRYAHDRHMNGGYHSDLSELMLDTPQIKLWTHGHTHEVFDYMIGETRVVCNPRGYIGHEELADRFELKVVEV
jgi:hypothetical protein